VAASKQTTSGIEQLMGVLKWGMSPDKVFGHLEKETRTRMEAAIKAATDPQSQDRLRQELIEKLKGLRENYTKFVGKQTPWDVSLVEKEFAHKNNESMVVIWGKEDRRFFFFHNSRLWKIYIAYNADLYQGKTFEDFAQVMERRFGNAERKFTVTLKGDQKMDHLAWPPSGKTLLRAIDNTGFYGNFCLMLVDKSELPSVNAGRKANSPPKDYSDPLVDVVTKGNSAGADENEDIVDRLTGKGTLPPAASDGASAPSEPPVPSSKSGAATEAKSPKKSPSAKKSPPKVNGKNPLEGLDL